MAESINKATSVNKRDKIDIRIDLRPKKEQATTSTQPDKSLGTKQKSADQAEKTSVTLKVAESLQGKKLMTKD